MLKVHNPTRQSRLCPGLGRNIEPYEIAETPEEFETCDTCQCVAFDDGAEPAEEPEAHE